MTTVGTLTALLMILAALLPLRGGAPAEKPRVHQPPSRGWLEAHGVPIPKRRTRPRPAVATSPGGPEASKSTEATA